MSEPKGNYRMKFVGKPGGKLMKNAPGNFTHGEIYNVPFNHSKWPFWEMLEKPPVLEAPEPSDADSVFDDNVFVPDEEVTYGDSPEITMSSTQSYGGDVVVDPNASAIIEPYMTYNTGTGQLSDVEDIIPEQTPEPEQDLDEPHYLKLEIARLQQALEDAKTAPPTELELVKEPDRDELLKTLQDAGVEVKPRTRMTTLRKMVDALGSQE